MKNKFKILDEVKEELHARPYIKLVSNLRTFHFAYLIKDDQESLAWKYLNKFLTHDQTIRGYSSLEEMLNKESEFDGISNTTPDKFHKDTSLKILDKGFNIFCEKPLAENYIDAKIMVESAQRANKIK